jgi:hypothetical protein
MGTDSALSLQSPAFMAAEFRREQFLRRLRSFPSRCKANLSSSPGVDKQQARVPKHRNQRFRLPAPFNWRSNLPLIAGTVLIVIAAMMLKHADERERALCDASRLLPAPLEARQPAAQLFPEAALVDPAIQKQAPPGMKSSPYMQFHSYADPCLRFDFRRLPGWKRNYLLSSPEAYQHQDMEVSVPTIVIRRHNPFLVARAEAAPPAKRSYRHLLLSCIAPVRHRVTFPGHMESSRKTAGALMPALSTMGSFQKQLYDLKDRCRYYPAAERRIADPDTYSDYRTPDSDEP